jgi:hypothetical protein
MKAITSLIALLLPAVHRAFTSPLPWSAAVASSRLGGDHWHHKCRRSNNNNNESTPCSPSSPSASPINRNPYTSPQLDTAAMAKYLIASITELSLFALAFASFDRPTSTFLHTPPSSLPIPLLSLLFYAVTLKSQILNSLNNTRSNRNMTIQWLSWSNYALVDTARCRLPHHVVAYHRTGAYSSSLIVHSTKRFLSLPLMSFILHLAMGEYNQQYRKEI